ncbi:unnamed protein product [Urochloa humidicola]
MERILRIIDVAADIDLMKVAHASQIGTLKFQIQSLENDLIRTRVTTICRVTEFSILRRRTSVLRPP